MAATYIIRPNLHPRGFRYDIVLPYGLTAATVEAAMNDIYDWLHKVNEYMVDRGWERLEESLLGNTFSGVISELLVRNVAKRTAGLVRNRKVGGRPDLLPAETYVGDEAQNADEGIELKASRQRGGWQGHNPEVGWVMVFQFEVDTHTERVEDRQPLRFVKVMIAQLTRDDWSASGRRGGSRRTPTASIAGGATTKLRRNWLYQDPDWGRLQNPRILGGA